MTTTVDTHQTTKADESSSSRQARAKRLKRLRKITTLSRKVFSERYGISPGTLQNWETARFGGLTEKGARAMLGFLSQENIHCTFEWLMYGAGQGPAIHMDTPSKSTQTRPTTPYHTALQKELEKFYQLHPQATHLTVMDDAMAPQFTMGETIAGTRLPSSQYDQLIDQYCIAETLEFGQIVRQVRRHSQTGGLCLVSINPNTPADRMVITQVTIHSLAPVIWKRRQDL